jgi:hypothetical protein
VHRVPNEFYGESMRWALSVPRAEVTDMPSTIIQGTVGGVFVDVLAQRFDRSWAVSANYTDDIAPEMPRRLGLAQTSAVGPWSGWVAQNQVEITGRASYASWPQPCSSLRSLIMIIAAHRQARPKSRPAHGGTESLAGVLPAIGSRTNTRTARGNARSRHVCRSEENPWPPQMAGGIVTEQLCQFRSRSGCDRLPKSA